MNSQKHPFHLVDPSPWPLFGSLGAFASTMGGVMYMHSYIGGGALLSLGLGMLIYTMIVWWRDVVRESTYEGHHTGLVQIGLRYGMILFIVSEVMFFLAFFWGAPSRCVTWMPLKRRCFCSLPHSGGTSKGLAGRLDRNQRGNSNVQAANNAGAWRQGLAAGMYRLPRACMARMTNLIRTYGSWNGQCLTSLYETLGWAGGNAQSAARRTKNSPHPAQSRAVCNTHRVRKGLNTHLQHTQLRDCLRGCHANRQILKTDLSLKRDLVRVAIASRYTPTLGNGAFIVRTVYPRCFSAQTINRDSLQASEREAADMLMIDLPAPTADLRSRVYRGNGTEGADIQGLISPFTKKDSKNGALQLEKTPEKGASTQRSIPSDVHIRKIASLKNLVAAYELIKSKPGNMTPGTCPETLDGISLEWIKTIQEQLKSGTYKTQPARRVWIPKPGKREKRPLGIASPREKVVQKAMQIVLEQAYEPTFLNSSHGFRPNRNCHSALQKIYLTFSGAQYIIEADISQCFDRISHKKLLSILSRKIRCDKTLKLIKSTLEAGYIDLGKLHQADQGSPQGSVLSPLLCNIYLHELDLFMEQVMNKYNTGTKRKNNSKYDALGVTIRRWRNSGRHQLQPAEFLEMKRRYRTMPSKLYDDSYVRVRYVRYADDFVIAISASYKKAEAIRSEVALFLKNELDLELNKGKTLITPWIRRRVHFLGAEIMASNKRGATKRVQVHSGAIRKAYKARISARTRLYMPVDKIQKKLHSKGFLKRRLGKNGLEYNGTRRKDLVNLDHADILRYYNACYRGLANYYSFAINRGRLGSIGWLLKESCALTLANKMKLRTMAKVFQRLGKHLECKIKLPPYKGEKGCKSSQQQKTIQFWQPKNLRTGSGVFNTSENLAYPFESLNRIMHNKFTRSALFYSCIICGEDKNVEMHHVRSIRTLRDRQSSKSWIERQMAAINRKQIPLCREHHQKVEGKLGGFTLEEKGMYSLGSKRFLRRTRTQGMKKASP